MSFSHTFFSSLFVLAFVSPLLASAHICTDQFLTEVSQMNITEKFCNTKTLKVEFGWNFNNESRRLDIAFGGRLHGETGWLAWGLNPVGPHMVGTRALIGIKRQDGTLEALKYNITAATKIGCQLLPSKDIGLDVRNFSFVKVNIGYYVIRATIFLPKEYNSSKANVVWQVGEHATESGPLMHPTSIKNFDTAEVIDLVSNKVIGYTAHRRRQLRTAHGILNIVGWGVFLPIGVIAARYFRKFPEEWSWWFVAHVSCQMAGYGLGLIGWGLGLWLGNHSKYYIFQTHRNIAIIIFTFATMQMFSLKLKPKATDEYRKYWNMYHHFLGYSLLAVVSVNIFYGIRIFGENKAWKWSYVGLLGTLGGVALVLEVYTWIKFFLNKVEEKKHGSKDQISAAVIPAPAVQGATITAPAPAVGAAT
ncbi:cytochrome b561 and DOMON domain-containing protein At4g12980-like [Henckelia pumila]|uniref:cytochrome b561 and DOMON domain-containing protein At4g12980-like n=1 Tax=Henckelia pumila TaxID=405737 RepID=UPI003C6E4135